MTNWHKKILEAIEYLAQMQFDDDGNLLVAGDFGPDSPLHFVDMWDASGGTYPPATEAGQFWIISVAGTIGGVDYEPHDWIVYIDDTPTWKKVDNTDFVISVDGRVGAVVLSDLYVPISLAWSKFKAESLGPTPPLTPINGAYYLISSGATGIWTGKGGQVGYYTTTGGWTYLTPTPQVEWWASKQENTIYYSTGTGWSLFATKVDWSNISGIPATFPPSTHGHETHDNLNWSDSGHSMDADLDMNGNNITEVDTIEGTAGSDTGIESSSDITLKVGDSSGVNKVQVKDSGDVVVASIDSNGKFTGDGSGLSGVPVETHDNTEHSEAYQTASDVSGAIGTHTADASAHHTRYTDGEAQAVADAQIGIHTAIASAHHTRYEDSEAISAMGVKGDTNPLNHDRYTDAEAQSIADTQIATHTAISSAHHSRYTDGEAVSAMGVKADNNPLNHDRPIQATETILGIAELATQAEADAGTSDLAIMTPLKSALQPEFVQGADVPGPATTTSTSFVLAATITKTTTAGVFKLSSCCEMLGVGLTFPGAVENQCVVEVRIDGGPVLQFAELCTVYSAHSGVYLASLTAGSHTITFYFRSTTGATVGIRNMRACLSKVVVS